jgi:hypothetical protein
VREAFAVFFTPGHDADRQASALAMAEIHHNRHDVEALNRVFDTYSDTITN